MTYFNASLMITKTVNNHTYIIIDSVSVRQLGYVMMTPINHTLKSLMSEVRNIILKQISYLCTLKVFGRN